MKSEKRRTTSKNPVLKKLGMKLTAKLLAVLLSTSLIMTSVPLQEVHASWFSDLCGGLFTFITAPIWVFCQDNPTFRKNNPFRKKKWEEDINFEFQPENPKDDYKLHLPHRTNYSDNEFLKREQEKQKEELEFLRKEINFLHTQQAADAAKIFHPSYATDHVKRQRAEAKRLAREQEEKQRKKEEAEREDAAEKEGNQKRDEYARRIKEFPEGIIQIILEEFDEIRNRYKPTKFIKYFPELMNSIEYKIKDYEERLEAKKKEVERQEAKRLKRERKEAKKAKKIEEVKQEVKKYREYFERQVRELRDKDRQTILEKFDKRSSKIKTMHELLHLNNEIMADIKSLPPPPKPTRRPMPTPQPQVEKRWRKA